MRRWKCPGCAAEHARPPQWDLLREARENDAVVLAMVQSRDVPCPACGRTVDIEQVANGRYDVETSPANRIDCLAGEPCRFCSGPADDPANAARVHFQRSGGGDGELELCVPRCAECRRAHDRVEQVGCGFGAIGGLAVVGYIVHTFLTTGKDFNDEPVGWGGVLAASLFLGGVSGAISLFLGRGVGVLFRPSRVRREADKFEHPRVKELEELGWEANRNA